MSSNRLELNAEKTQFIWLGKFTPFNLEKVDIQSVNLGAGTVLVQNIERQWSWSTDRQHTVHEGPCAPSVSDFVLSASPDSCISGNLSRVRLPRHWCMLSSPVDLIIATACFMELISHYWTSCKPSCVPLQEWFWRNSNSIIFRMTFVTNCTGYLFSLSVE